MLLQERIEELGSGILTITDTKIELIGFTCIERLEDYYLRNKSCFLSMGLYDPEALDFSRIQDDALFIVKDHGKEYRYQFTLLRKDTVKYKVDKKWTNKVFSIRKSNFSDKFNYKDAEVSILFNTIQELNDYFFNRYGKDLTQQILMNI